MNVTTTMPPSNSQLGSKSDVKIDKHVENKDALKSTMATTSTQKPSTNLIKSDLSNSVSPTSYTIIESQFQKFEKSNEWDAAFESLEDKCDDMYGDLSRDIAKESTNSEYNRYRSILPYDHSRVKLTAGGLRRSVNHDYINANLVICTLPIKNTLNSTPGIDNKDNLSRKYIVTQGPLANTLPDFWQMLVENDVRIIMMLCNVEEDGKNKCHQYFPSSPTPISDSPSGTTKSSGNNGKIRFGTGTKDVETLNFKENEIKLRIRQNYIKSPFENVLPSLAVDKEEMISKTSTNEFLFREIELTSPGEPEVKRVIYHCHYLSWPDFGVPNVDSFLRYWKTVRSIEMGAGIDTFKSPWVVHCSAGIGRSGTLVLIDAALRILEMNESIDTVNVSDLVIEMRKYRKGMIQTADQLRFAFQAIVQAYKGYQKRQKMKDIVEKPVGEVKDTNIPQPKVLPTKGKEDKSGKIKATKPKISTSTPFTQKVLSQANKEDSTRKDKSLEPIGDDETYGIFLKNLTKFDASITKFDSSNEWPLLMKKIEAKATELKKLMMKDKEGTTTSSTSTALGKTVQCKTLNREYETIPSNCSILKSNIGYIDDDDRIFLKYKTGLGSIDYVNASQIMIKSLKRSYILAQAPLESTWEDFMMMAWEQECSIIVMLSNPITEKDMCFAYWLEDDPLLSAENLVKTEIKWEQERYRRYFNNKTYELVNKGLKYSSGTFDIRQLEIVCKQNKTSQPFTQIVFKEWPSNYSKLTDNLPTSVSEYVSAKFLDFYLAYTETGVFLSLKGSIIIHGNVVIDRPAIFMITDAYLTLAKQNQNPNVILPLELMSEVRLWRNGLLGEDPFTLKFTLKLYRELCKCLAENWFTQSSGETPTIHTPSEVFFKNQGEEFALQSSYKRSSQMSLLEKAQTGKLKSILTVKPPPTEIEVEEKSRDKESKDIADKKVQDEEKLNEKGTELKEDVPEVIIKPDQNSTDKQRVKVKVTKNPSINLSSSSRSPSNLSSVSSLSGGEHSSTASSSINSSNKLPINDTNSHIKNRRRRHKSLPSITSSSMSSLSSSRSSAPEHNDESRGFLLPSVLAQNSDHNVAPELIRSFQNLRFDHTAINSTHSTQTGPSLTNIDPSYMAYLKNV